MKGRHGQGACFSALFYKGGNNIKKPNLLKGMVNHIKRQNQLAYVQTESLFKV